MPADSGIASLKPNAPTVRRRVQPRQRVLMVGDVIGGVWRYTLDLSAALIARGHSVALATMGGMPSREQRAEVGAIAGLEYYPSSYKLLWMDEPWPDVHAAGEWLQALAARVRPSIVHLNDFGHGALTWPAPVLTVGHSCVLSWWQAVHGSAAPERWLRYRRAVEMSLRGSDLVVAPTRAMLRALEQHYGPLAATRVIANGSSRVAGITQAKQPLVLCAGRLWDAGKNVTALASIAAQLSWPVCIAGAERSPDGERMQFPNVRLLGQLGSAQLLRWYARAPIYALPAKYEPFGLSILEAALAGCALVIGDIPSLRSIWDGAALFVAPDDHAELARALQHLIADAALRERYAARARQRAQCYSATAMAGAYTQAYAELDAQRLRSAQRRVGGGR